MLVQNQYNLGIKSLAVLLMALLVLLTSINFFFYAEKASNRTIALTETNAPDGTANFPEENEPSPQGPDEKGPGNPVSVSEEYLPEAGDPSSLYSDNLVHQLILVCTKVAPVHFEIIVPPPNTIC